MMTGLVSRLVGLAMLASCGFEHGNLPPSQEDTDTPGGIITIVDLQTGLPMSAGVVRVERAGTNPPVLVFEREYLPGDLNIPLLDGPYRIEYEPSGLSKVFFPNWDYFRSKNGEYSVLLKVSTREVSQELEVGKGFAGFEGEYEVLLRMDQRITRQGDFDGPTRITIGNSDRIIPLVLPIGIQAEANALVFKREGDWVGYLLLHAAWISVEGYHAELAVTGGILRLSLAADSRDRLIQLTSGNFSGDPKRLKRSFNLPLLSVDGYCQLNLPAGITAVEARGLPTGPLSYQIFTQEGELLAESATIVE